jgi:hypothetical protein
MSDASTLSLCLGWYVYVLLHVLCMQGMLCLLLASVQLQACECPTWMLACILSVLACCSWMLLLVPVWPGGQG